MGHITFWILALVTVSMASDATQVYPRVIYGADDRIEYYQAEASEQRLAEATVALLRKSQVDVKDSLATVITNPYGPTLDLCPDEPFYEQDIAPFCSGVLVTPTRILTAGHCVRTQLACQNTSFVFGFRLEVPGHSPKTLPKSFVFSCQKLVFSVANPLGEDFAVIELDRPVTHVEPVPLRQQGQLSLQDELFVVGHPAGLPLKLAANAFPRQVFEQYFLTNLDTYGGNSGSPVFNSQTGLLEGVLVRGEMDFVYKKDCRVSNRCADSACRGEDVTLIERAKASIFSP